MRQKNSTREGAVQSSDDILTDFQDELDLYRKWQAGSPPIHSSDKRCFSPVAPSTELVDEWVSSGIELVAYREWRKDEADKQVFKLIELSNQSVALSFRCSTSGCERVREERIQIVEAENGSLWVTRLPPTRCKTHSSRDKPAPRKVYWSLKVAGVVIWWSTNHPEYEAKR